MTRALVSTIVAFVFIGCGGAPAPVTDAPTPPKATPVPAATPAPAAAPAPVTESAAPATQAAAVLPNDGTRKVGDVTRCVVSDEVFTVTEKTAKAEYEGKTYYVCCGGCTRKFKSNPAQFVGAKAK